jgi:hypothetical protein
VLRRAIGLQGFLFFLPVILTVFDVGVILALSIFHSLLFFGRDGVEWALFVLFLKFFYVFNKVHW